jgi:acyl dehydratase
LRLTALEMLERSAEPQIYPWTDRDYLLYALALGLGSDSQYGPALSFVYEEHLRVVPTFPTVLAWVAEPTFASLGAHPDFALHAGQSIELHRVLDRPETVTVSGRVVAVHDKGRDRGALIVMRQEVVRATDGAPIATLETSCFARDAGGCGSTGKPPAVSHRVPDRPPDHRVVYAVHNNAALLYRLTGDRNPLHADPKAAQAAGFERPILHGLCSFGMTCRAVLECIAEWHPERIISHSARFSAPVYPGDRLEVSLWREGREVCFAAHVAERSAAVITGGRAVLG